MNEEGSSPSTISGVLPARIPEQRMNSGCYCVSLDRDALRLALEAQLGSQALVALIEERCPFLFSAMPVFVSESQHQQMEAVVKALEFVIGMSSYRDRVLASAAPIARHDPGGARGVFFGYDFHLVADAIGLIEINTNAGGAMLNAVMARAHRACTIGPDQLAAAAESGLKFEAAIMKMFLSEWEHSKRGRALRSIAIVDTAPQAQYLYPEFILFKQLFERHGLRAFIAGPAQLQFRDGALWCEGEQVDLVYNRLTDFTLDDVLHADLRQAYLDGAIVVTPHPQAHALYADKRNLAILSSAVELDALGVPQSVQEILLAAVLPTELVNPGEAARLWQNRRKLFFKPTSGYGGRAAYRGDKLTKGVWQDILGGEYVAQQIMAPGERVAGSSTAPEKLKFDLRMYAYETEVQWTAARVYQGQTTNFRTPGGGFAPVYHLAQTPSACAVACLKHKT